MEYNLVEIWLRRDPIRWLSGVLGGLVAGVIAMLVGMLIATSTGMEASFPIKLMGTIVLGASATELNQTQGAVVGFLVLEFICVFWGVIFAHFTGTNSLKALLPMGLVWAAFSWIFIWNLFLPSFNTILAAQVSAGAALPVCIAYGLGLSTISFFDSALRKAKQV
jgi:hypothetical protein